MSLKTKAMRILFNRFPVFRNTGARIIDIADDQQTIRVKLPLNRGTKNYVGTIYGGSMYSALDGILMVMFIRLLGKGYTVWDKAGRIEYLKPGRETLYAEIEISNDELDWVRSTLETTPKIEKEYTLEWRNEAGDVICRVYKLLYFRPRKK